MKLFDVYNRFNISLDYGRGVHLYNKTGDEYLDLYGGHGVISIGHSHPDYVDALTNQLQKIGFYSNAIQIEQQELLAERLGSISGYENHQLFLCNSGAEANENALKLASFHTGKKRVIAFKNAFHGRTTAALNVTDNQSLSPPLCDENFPVEMLPLNDFEALDQIQNPSEIAAVIIEGIQGVGGLDEPSETFLIYLSVFCKKNGALLILDEIQSGCGRTGQYFAHQKSSIQADIISMAKGMGNGFPVAGLLIHPDIKAKKGMLGTTFGGNYLACEAAISVAEVISENELMQHVQSVSNWLIQELNQIEGVVRIKGRGLMLGVEFDFPISDLRKNLLEKEHIFTGGSANQNLLRILPPLTIEKEELVPFVAALKKINQ